MSRPAPLQGLRVIDLTQVLAGPYCTYQLALLGAEVIKVEPPSGDVTRQGGPIAPLADEAIGLTFCVQNSAKQSVVVDLKADGGADHVLALAADCDVFVQNFRPGVADRLGVGEDAVRALNPKVIYCSISAYGGDGPIGHRPAFDHVVQAMSGIMTTTGTDDTGPLKVGAPYVDYATGLNGAFAIMAALRERDRTGEGQSVSVAMLDTALNLMASNVVNVSATARDMPKLGNEAASRAPSSGTFVAGDGEMITLAANNERQFADLCRALEHPEWITDSRWANPTARSEHQDALRVALAAAFETKSAADWEERCDEYGVPAARIRRLTEVLAEGQPAARELLHTVHCGTEQIPIEVPGVGFRINGVHLGPTSPPPGLGEHTEAWLSPRQGPNHAKD